MRWAVLPFALVACYSPSPQPGAPCPDGVCPSPLICSPVTMKCETTAGPSIDADGIVDAEIDAQLRDGCTPEPELCGDGIDQDCDNVDPGCPPNDRAANPIDITGGGTFTADLTFAHDDVAANGCSGDGGRDLYYSITLNAPRVYYFDTFGSSFDTVVRAYAKPCSMVGTGASAASCGNDSCGGNETQLAVSLPAGQSCIVIDQDSAAETNGDVMLRAIAGTRDGMPLPSGMQMLTGNTAGSTNIWDPVDVNCDAPGSGGKDLAYFFTLCPSTTLLLDAETCTGATWDTVLYVRNGATTQIGCNDDACGNLQSRITNVPIQNGVFFWLVIDAFDATFSGTYTLKTNLR